MRAMMSTTALPRRLTQLFADTKKSYEHVVQAQHNAPEAASLHLKLRIQKDRLIAWGIQWSDRSTASQAGDIDGSLDRAGISELVGSIMCSIRELLDEAEGLQPIQSLELTTGFGELKGFGKSLQEPVWTTSSLNRLEEILKDLTTSIDTLCDLSRDRPRIEHSTTTSNAPDSIFERFSDSRPPSTTPSSGSILISSVKNLELDHIAPNRLRLRLSASQPGSAPPSYESVATGWEERALAFLSSRRDSNPGRKSSIKNGELPVLLDYGKRYMVSDASYVKPDADRYEELSSALEWIFQESGTSYQGLLRLEGWTVDTDNPRCAYVYEVPIMHRSLRHDDVDLQPRSLLSFLQNGGDTDSTNVPSLENRFRLAHNLASSLMLLHGRGVSHRNISSNNVIFFVGGNFLSSNDKIWKGPVLRLPYLTAFHQMSSTDQDCSNDPIYTGIYQHPSLGDGQSTKYTLAHDLYSLGLILLEIGLWMPIGKFWKAKYTRRDFKTRLQEIYLRKLSGKCGEGYMNVVFHCMTAVEGSVYPDPSQASSVGASNPADSLSVMGPLQRCCLIDGSQPVDRSASLANGPVPVLEEHHRQAYGVVAYPPGGNVLASAHNDTKIRLLDMDTGMLRTHLEGHCGLVLALAFSADGRILASGSVDCTICLWDTVTWALRNTLVSHSGAVTAVAFSPNSTILASGSNDYTVRLWEVATGALLITLEDHPNPIKGVDFSPDGKVLTSRSMDEAVRLWDVATGTLCSSLHNYSAQAEVILADATSNISNIQDAPKPTKLVDSQQYSLPRKDDPRSQVSKDLGSTVSLRPLQDDAIEKREAKIQSKSGRSIKVWSHELPTLYTNYWSSTMFPRLERILSRAISRWESYTIDLFMAGAEPDIARPTVYMECTSTAKVRKILRHLNKELRLFDIKVVSGQIVRSKGGKKRSHKNTAKTRNVSRSKSSTEVDPLNQRDLNPFYEQVPTCGASIGAYHDGVHLPPVSFGGAVLVDGKTYGMSVHHMLEEEDDLALGLDDVHCFSRSMAPRPGVMDSHRGSQGLVPEVHNDHEGLYLFEVSEPAEVPDSPSIQGDTFSDYSSNLDSQEQLMPQPLYPFELLEDDFDDNAEAPEDDEFWLSPDFDKESTSMTYYEEDDAELGDTVGVKAGCGENLIVTQPAIDDVHKDFFPCEEYADEEHLSSHMLGHIHASSGIKRFRRDQIIHEIDWALIKINEPRSRFHNIVQGGGQYCKVSQNSTFFPQDTLPLEIMNANELGGLQVHAFGRTSGLQTGMILPAMRMVRMPGRSFASHSWQVRGNFGEGGDSGAWVIDNATGKVCGHVLAHSERSAVTYIAPMEVLVEDISITLNAKVTLPSLEKHEMWKEERTRKGLIINKETPAEVAKQGNKERRMETVQRAREVIREDREREVTKSPELPTSPPALVHEMSELSLNELGREEEGKVNNSPKKRSFRARGGEIGGGLGRRGGTRGGRGRGRGGESEEGKQPSVEVREIRSGGSRGKGKEMDVQYLCSTTMPLPIRTGGVPRARPKSVRFEESTKSVRFQESV